MCSKLMAGCFLRRALQAAQAVATVGQDYLLSTRRGAPDPPPVVLRKLFNQLGSTYIKLGQFVASSPTLFPPEYVLEMEKCLDAAPPVPWERIKCVCVAGVETLQPWVAQLPW